MYKPPFQPEEGIVPLHSFKLRYNLYYDFVIYIIDGFYIIDFI